MLKHIIKMKHGGARIGAGRRRYRSKRFSIQLSEQTLKKIRVAMEIEDRHYIGPWIERAALYYLETHNQT